MSISTQEAVAAPVGACPTKTGDENPPCYSDIAQRQKNAPKPIAAFCDSPVKVEHKDGTTYGPCRACATCLRVTAEQWELKTIIEMSWYPTTYFLTLTKPPDAYLRQRSLGLGDEIADPDRNRALLMGEFKSFMDDLTQEAKAEGVSFSWLRASEPHAKNGQWHIHLVFNCDQGFDPERFRNWDGLTDIRLARGPGLPLDNHIKKGAAAGWHQQRRLNHDAHVQPSTVDGHAGIARYITDYVVKDARTRARPGQSRSKHNSANLRNFGSSKEYGHPRKLLQLCGLTRSDAFERSELFSDVQLPWFHKFGRLWLHRDTVIALAVDNGLERRQSRIDRYGKKLWRLRALILGSQILMKPVKGADWTACYEGLTDLQAQHAKRWQPPPIPPPVVTGTTPPF